MSSDQALLGRLGLGRASMLMLQLPQWLLQLPRCWHLRILPCCSAVAAGNIGSGWTPGLGSV